MFGGTHLRRDAGGHALHDARWVWEELWSAALGDPGPGQGAEVACGGGGVVMFAH